MEYPEIVYKLYNDTAFDAESFVLLRRIFLCEEPVHGIWVDYRQIFDEFLAIFDEFGYWIEHIFFKETLKDKFERIARQHILINTKVDPESLLSGHLPLKTDTLWTTIKTDRPSFRSPNLYGQYKRKNSRCSGEFEKYYKVRGLTLISTEWAEKFADIKKIEEGQFYKYMTNVVIPDRVMSVLEELFILSPEKTFWPLITNIVSDAEVRSDPTYPLISFEDLLKIEYLTSFIIDAAVERSILVDFCMQFIGFKKDDIRDWKEKAVKKNPRYKQLLEKADRMKK